MNYMKLYGTLQKHTCKNNRITKMKPSTYSLIFLNQDIYQNILFRRKHFFRKRNLKVRLKKKRQVLLLDTIKCNETTK